MPYQIAATAFKLMFGYEPRADIERLLSEEWDVARCETDAEFNEFYRESLLMTEEGAKWHAEKRGQRMRRAIHAGTIARQLGFDSFAEVGAGIGTDAITLAKMGFQNAYVAEINRYSLKMMARCADVASANLTIVDLSRYTKEMAHDVYGPVDWLFSSDVFEHIRDLEGWLDPWIRGFKCVIVYAPFGTSDKNHAHTSYSKIQFNKFMDRQGFDKVRVHGFGIPPMVYTRKDNA